MLRAAVTSSFVESASATVDSGLQEPLEAAPRTGARPRLGEPDTRDYFLELLRSGIPVGTAARASGLHRASVYAAIRKGEDQERRKVRGLYRDFLDMYRRARAEGRAHLHLQVAAAAEREWKAAAWLLARMDPRTYGSLERLRIRAEQVQFLEKLRLGLPPDIYEMVLSVAGSTEAIQGE